MTTVITPTESSSVEGFKVFLAGAIDMGAAPDWQADVIERMSDRSGLIIFNPRREKFTDETLDGQIRWELDALNKANVILLWFPAGTEAPISLLETGLYMNSGKLVLGAEPGYFRRRNLELTTEYFGQPLWGSLQDLIDETLRRYSKYPHDHRG